MSGMYLRCAIHQTPTQWKQGLPLAQLWYNSCLHTSLGCSPFHALYGHTPNLGVLSSSVLSTADSDPSVAEILQAQVQHTAMLREQLAIGQKE